MAGAAQTPSHASLTRQESQRDGAAVRAHARDVASWRVAVFIPAAKCSLQPAARRARPPPDGPSEDTGSSHPASHARRLASDCAAAMRTTREGRDCICVAKVAPQTCNRPPAALRQLPRLTRRSHHDALQSRWISRCRDREAVGPQANHQNACKSGSESSVAPLTMTPAARGRVLT